jgi:L-2-hydroxyglutarate oxidase LhgO
MARSPIILVRHLVGLPGCQVHYRNRVTNLVREQDGRWLVEVQDLESGERLSVKPRLVFIGAGGGALPLLQKSGIPEGRGYGGFPVSGIWLRCDDPFPYRLSAALGTLAGAKAGFPKWLIVPRLAPKPSPATASRAR